MDRGLSRIAEWLRVRHAGAPRWFLGFLVVFGGAVATVLTTR